MQKLNRGHSTNIVSKRFFQCTIAEKFLDQVMGTAAKIREFLKKKISIEKLSQVQWEEFKSAKNCSICKKPFGRNEKKVRDHDHLMG